MSKAEQFGWAVAKMEAELNWDVLGQTYCHEGGESFFAEEQREAIRETGLLLAADLQDAVRRLPGGTLGRSLWVGAALAELIPILAEHLVLGRHVHWHNIECGETRELNRALQAVEEQTGLDLPRVETHPAPSENGYDLLWMVSVLTDPDAFPALHDELYGRRGTELSAGPGDLGHERELAQSWTRSLLQQVSSPGVLVTSDEEAGFFLGAAQAASRRLVVPEQGRLSGIVGDVVRFCRVQNLDSDVQAAFT